MVNPTPLNILSTNDAKGHYFETRIQRLLTEYNISFTGNPLDPKAWKKNVAKGPDIKIPSLNLEIECKAVYSDVWLSSLYYHYMPRFTSNTKHKLVVTNDLTKFSSKHKETLRNAHIKLLNPIYLIQYILKLLFKSGEANTISSVNHIISNCNCITFSFKQFEYVLLLLFGLNFDWIKNDSMNHILEAN